MSLLAFGAIFAGALLVYAGLTGQSLLTQLAAILSGKAAA